MSELTAKERQVLEWVGRQGSSVLMVNLDGHLTKPLEKMTAEEILAAHEEALISKYMEMYKSSKVAELRSVGERLVELPEEQQELLMRIPTLSPARIQQIAQIVTEAVQPPAPPVPEPSPEPVPTPTPEPEPPPPSPQPEPTPSPEPVPAPEPTPVEETPTGG